MKGHVIDMAGLKMVQPPGLRSPKQRITYVSAEVQEHLCLAFGGILPWMQVVDDDYARYLWDEGDGRDTCAESLPVESMAAIPKGEMLRLMEGWIMLRKLAQNPELPPGMDTILLNFRIPDPRHAPDFYRVYRCAKTGRQRMHVLWGFESPKRPSVPVDRAVAALFGVPVDNIGSILATSFASHGTTEMVPTSATRRTTATQVPVAPAPTRHGGFPRAWVAAGLGIALVGGGGVWAGIALSGGRPSGAMPARLADNPQGTNIAGARSADISHPTRHSPDEQDRSLGPAAIQKADTQEMKQPTMASSPRPETIGLESMLLARPRVSSQVRESTPVSVNRMVFSDVPPDAR